MTVATGLPVSCEGLVHIYRLHGNDVVALRGIDLDVAAGSRLALLGPSGSGKSTVLALLAGLLRPSAGRLRIGGYDVGRMSQRELLGLRARQVGVVLQNPGRNLLPYSTPLDNIDFAQRMASRGRRTDPLPKAADLLDRLGLGGVARQPVLSLSGGEQQRLALAVGLAHGPGLLLADEPTSQLDLQARREVVGLLRQANEDLGTTVVVVTHDPDVGEGMGRTVTIRDGRVGTEGRLGEEYAVVGRDGSVQLPPGDLDVLPPGTLVRVVRHSWKIELQHPDRGPDEDAR